MQLWTAGLDEGSGKTSSKAKIGSKTRTIAQGVAKV